MDHVTADVAIALWGFQNWNWGTESFHFRTEDWFEEDSDTGGSDKTGHFYMTYLLSRVLASRMEDRGWSLGRSISLWFTLRYACHDSLGNWRWDKSLRFF